MAHLARQLGIAHRPGGQQAEGQQPHGLAGDQGVVAIHGGAVPALRSATAAAVALAGTIDRSRKFVHQDANRSQQLPARPGVYQRYFFSPASPRRANSMTKTSRAPKSNRRHGPITRTYSWQRHTRETDSGGVGKECGREG